MLLARLTGHGTFTEVVEHKNHTNETRNGMSE